MRQDCCFVRLAQLTNIFGVSNAVKGFVAPAGGSPDFMVIELTQTTATHSGRPCLRNEQGRPECVARTGPDTYPMNAGALPLTAKSIRNSVRSMPRIVIQDGPGTIHSRMYQQLRPEYGAADEAMRTAVKDDSILPWRIIEAIRFRNAVINGCLLCQSARMPGAIAEGFSEPMYGAIDGEGWRTSELFTDRERLAMDYADRFSRNHASIDDNFWEQLHATFTDAEILDLTFVTGRYLSFGRLTHVLGLDDSCEVPQSAGKGTSAVNAY